jgi:HEAT repeat protein
VRHVAATTLWGMGAKARAAVPGLAQLLSDTETGLRVAAAMALANMGPAAKDAVPALVVALKDRESEVRQWAAKALGAIGPGAQAAIPALVQAARVEPVRQSAEEAIRQIRGAGPEPGPQPSP